MISQVADTVMLIRPVSFASNTQTAINNFFQHGDSKKAESDIQVQALKEFDLFARTLDKVGIDLLIIEDSLNPHTPDSIYPNNWISTHQDGRVITYPMFAENRRLERRDDVIDKLIESYIVSEVLRLDNWENEGHFLESTGSLVLDRINMQAFAALSDRAHLQVIRDFEERTEFNVFTFHANQAYQDRRVPIYHTNLMMYIGASFVTVCLECVDDLKERMQLRAHFESLGKEIIEISEEQLMGYSGNGLQLCNKSQESFIVMSTAAYSSLNQNQRKALEKYGEIIHSPLNTIEYYGGGSARCMIAEIFLTLRDHD